MTAYFVPSAYPQAPGRSRSGKRNRPDVAAPARARRKDAAAVTWCVLAVLLLLEAAVLFAPHLLVVSPLQATPWFKRASGYTMFGLLAFAMVFGWVRRLPAMARHQRLLNDVHHFAGFLILVLLASHIGHQPSGFLLCTFHAMAIGLGAGALRALAGPRIGRTASISLLSVHIGLTCLVAAAVLLHLYFVYAYTA